MTPQNANTKQETIFEEAQRLISVDRRSDYGDAASSFANIASIWTVILGIPVTRERVAMCMVGLKLVRQKNRHKRDNLVDMCGYLGLIDQMENNKPVSDVFMNKKSWTDGDIESLNKSIQDAAHNDIPKGIRV